MEVIRLPAGLCRKVQVRRDVIKKAAIAVSEREPEPGNPTIHITWRNADGKRRSALAHAVKILGTTRLISLGHATWIETEGEILCYVGEEFHTDDGHEELRRD